MKKILLSSLAFATLIQAAPLGLVTHTEFGYIQNNGNTEDETMTLDAKLTKEWEKHISTTTLIGQYGTENNTENKNKWIFNTQYDYKFIDSFAFNYLVGYKTDKFTSFDYQAFTGPGAKYIPISNKTQTLNISANILYSIDAKADIYSSDGTDTGVIVAYPNTPSTTDTKIIGSGIDDKYTGYRAALDYSLQMLENLKFTQVLTYRNSFKDSKNYFLYSKSGISSKISDIFSAGLSYSYDYVNLPQSGDKNFDSVLTATLSLDY